MHHVASVYPVEIQLAQTLANGTPITGVTMDNVHEMNAAHAKEYDAVTKDAALDLLRRNSAVAAAAIRALSDEELDRAATASLYSEPRSHASSCSRITPCGKLSPPRPHSRDIEVLTQVQAAGCATGVMRISGWRGPQLASDAVYRDTTLKLCLNCGTAPHCDLLARGSGTGRVDAVVHAASTARIQGHSTAGDDQQRSPVKGRHSTRNVTKRKPSNRGRVKRMDVLIQDLYREEPAPTGVAFDRLLDWLDDGVDSDGSGVYPENAEATRRLLQSAESPDRGQLADETLNRIAKTHAEGRRDRNQAASSVLLHDREVCSPRGSSARACASFGFERAPIGKP